jgi:photosystem II stability/assembly factor-like uncharacterized protein
MRFVLCAGAVALLAACSGGSPAAPTRTTAATTPPASATATPSTATATAAAANSSRARETFTDVQFVNVETGWVLGSRGVLGTTDGGVHWVRLLSRRFNAFGGFDRVDFVSATTGWVTDGHSLLATTDGGRHWVSRPVPGRLVDLHFATRAAGTAVTGSGRAYRTNDGGSRWQPMPTPAGATSLCLSATGSGYLGARSAFYATSNSGRTWRPLGPRSRQLRHWGYVAQVRCAGTQAWGLLISPQGAASQKGHIGYHLTADAAHALFAERYFPYPRVRVKRESPGSYPGPMSPLSQDAAVFVDWCPACGYGTAPMFIATDDGQRITDRRPGRGLTTPHGASFITAQDGWLVAEHVVRTGRSSIRMESVVAHTSDGGATWTTQLRRDS